MGLSGAPRPRGGPPFWEGSAPGRAGLGGGRGWGLCRLGPGMRVRDGKAWEIGRLASGSHGVVTREELLRAGLSRSAIGRGIDAGGLLVVHRGVYRVGHRAPSVEATYLAAVRAAGVRSVLSGPAGGWLLGVVKGRAPRAEVTGPTKRRINGVITRRRNLDPRDRTT